jgi:hypothetical protein
VTSETSQGPAIQEPPIIIVQAPPLHFAAPEQNNPNIIIIFELEKQPPTQTLIPKSPLQNVEISQPEPHTPQPEQNTSEPDNTQPQATNQTEIAEQPPITIETLDNYSPLSSYPSSPASEQPTHVYGPVYKPLTYGEFVLPSEQIQPLIEASMKQAIDIDDSFELPPLNAKIDISKIIIKPLTRKRKMPEPTIPFNRDQPFFNPASEPNLELLNIAVDISLKRLKNMKEEAFVFPSDVDAEARKIEEKFRESLHLLAGYVKDNIKGKGMGVVRSVMDKA